MNPARLAEIALQRAALYEDLARLERAAAAELAGEADEAPAPAATARKVPVREPHRPAPRDVAPIAQARARRALNRIQG